MWTFSVTWSVCVRYIYLLHNFPLFLLFSLWENGVKWHFENMSYTIKCFPSPLRHSRCSAIFWLLDILILLLRPGVTQPSKYTHRNERPQGVEYPLLFSHSGCRLMCWRQCFTLSLTLKMSGLFKNSQVVGKQDRCSLLLGKLWNNQLSQCGFLGRGWGPVMGMSKVMLEVTLMFGCLSFMASCTT